MPPPEIKTIRPFQPFSWGHRRNKKKEKVKLFHHPNTTLSCEEKFSMLRPNPIHLFSPAESTVRFVSKSSAIDFSKLVAIHDKLENE